MKFSREDVYAFMKFSRKDEDTKFGKFVEQEDIRTIQRVLRKYGCNYQIANVASMVDAIQSGLPKNNYTLQSFERQMQIPPVEYLGVRYPGVNTHNVDLDGNCSIHYTFPKLTVSDIASNGMVSAYIQEQRRNILINSSIKMEQKYKYKRAREDAKTMSNINNSEQIINFLLEKGYIDNEFFIDGINKKPAESRKMNEYLMDEDFMNGANRRLLSAKSMNLYRASKTGIPPNMRPIHWKMIEKLNELGICVIDFDEFMKKRKDSNGEFLPFVFLSRSANVSFMTDERGDISTLHFSILSLY